jgi:SAM-dependent MidA family methyltransferase
MNPQSHLPEPGPDAAAASAALTALIANEVRARGGWMPFARYMELALYAPGLGYYSGGAHKFGDFAAGGDFVTAPEITPLFGRALARQIVQVLHAATPHVIEAGAGSGRLAADLLPALDALGCLPERYGILEVSGTLRSRQEATIREHAPQYRERVYWLDELPEQFSGCLIGNEVLDAMPSHPVRWVADGLREGGVSLQGEQLIAADGPLLTAPDALQEAANDIAQACALSAPFRSEISLAVRAWVGELSRRLVHGALILIDYGLSRAELYHPMRDGGTIRCHYRHHVHDAPLWFPGLSDITSHVDFTAVAEAGFAQGCTVAGYTTQAHFLMNCGIGELLADVSAKVSAGDTAIHAEPSAPDAAYRAQNSVMRLISPNEMGELFKVIALTKNIGEPLLGFTRSDRTHTL